MTRQGIVSEALGDPRGVVRLGLVEVLSPIFSSSMKAFSKRNCRSWVVAIDRTVNLIDERIDVAVRVRATLFYLASYIDCALLTCSQFALVQSTNPCVGRSRLLPKSVISYSTRGGTSGKSSRITNPSRSRFFSVEDSIRWEIPGTARSSSENRARPPRRSSERTTKIVHLSPIFVSSSRTAIGSELPQIAAGSNWRALLGSFITYLSVSG